MIERKTRKRKGLFFTTDAVVAALLMIAGLLLITSSYVSEQPKTLINTMAQDMLNILSEMQVWEANNTFIQALVDNGTITDTNLTLLEQIGELWANDKELLAGEFAENVSEGILKDTFGYSILLDDDTIYTRTVPVTNALITSKKLLTGVQKSKPLKGFIAKIRATAVHKTSSMVIPFSPAGAGWKGSTSDPGIVQVIKYFELPNVSVLNATMYLSVHLDRGSPNWNVVEMNGGVCNITRDDLDLAPGSEGVFRLMPLNDSCFSAGNNSIQLDMRNLGYNAHIHPGTFLLIHYNLTEEPVLLTQDRSERIYFDNINSTEGGTNDGAGPWVITPFHIPEDALNISVSIQVAGRGVFDYTESCTPSRRFWGWGGEHCKRDYDYIIFLNDDVPFDDDGSPDEDPLYTYTPAQTRPYIINGTNIIAVYFNNYDDDVWGTGTELIYSEPIDNSSGSSYVEVNYTVEEIPPYSVIEVRIVEEFGGLANYSKDTNFSFPPESEAISKVFLHPVESYSYFSEAYSDTGFPPGQKVFESPAARAVPSEIFVPESTMDDSPSAVNYVRLVELSLDDVLPNSTVDYGFYMKSAVGFGEVFASYGDAVDDAIERLQDQLGDYINASEMVIENISMSGVPSLWGPAVAEVRVWD